METISSIKGKIWHTYWLHLLSFNGIAFYFILFSFGATTVNGITTKRKMWMLRALWALSTVANTQHDCCAFDYCKMQWFISNFEALDSVNVQKDCLSAENLTPFDVEKSVRKPSFSFHILWHFFFSILFMCGAVRCSLVWYFVVVKHTFALNICDCDAEQLWKICEIRRRTLVNSHYSLLLINELKFIQTTTFTPPQSAHCTQFQLAWGAWEINEIWN